jgi:glyoxylase-like metal-dependent hydrolase (beta-lactamase superfamily II)
MAGGHSRGSYSHDQVFAATIGANKTDDSRGESRRGDVVIFENLSAGGCQSYLVGCAQSCAAVLIDPEISLIDRYVALAARHGLRLHYLIDTHTHADHFSATRELSRQLHIPVAMNRLSPAPFVDLRLDDGEMLALGKLRLQVLHTPGHTRDSMCLRVEDRLFTGDTLLISGTGRTDLPTGDPDALYDSLFNRVLRLDPALLVHPAHEYKGRSHSTIADELSGNPRLQVRDPAAFGEMMRNLNLNMPTHVTEALRTNMSGGKTVAQLLAEAAATVPYPWSAAAAPRPAGVARQSGIARSDAPNRGQLRIWPNLDPCHSDPAHNGLSACRGARWRHEGLARSGVSIEAGTGAVAGASTGPSTNCRRVRLWQACSSGSVRQEPLGPHKRP